MLLPAILPIMESISEIKGVFLPSQGILSFYMHGMTQVENFILLYIGSLGDFLSMECKQSCK